VKEKSKYNGFAIALAWPQTYCKQPGSWYDPLACRLGISKNHYYRVGHAAVVLIDIKSGKCHYFDFGRYHTPVQHGRVRSAETDHELTIHSIPAFSDSKNTIVNFKEILSEIQHNKSCHGEGTLYASYCKVNFENALGKSNRMQEESPIPYGPFLRTGSNCSRFVNTVIRAGNPKLKYRFRLKYMVPLSPTPMNNVNALGKGIKLPAQLNEVPFSPTNRLDKNTLYSTLKAPAGNGTIPENAQWLSGEGAGSWYVVEAQNSLLKVSRYSPEGKLECSHHYKNSKAQVTSPDNSFRITYPSNCNVVSFENWNIRLQFERIHPN